MARVRSRWVEALAALDAVVAGIMVTVGVYLIDPAAADLGFYMEAGRYALVGGFLVYAGIVLAHAAVFGLMPARTGFLAIIGAVLLGSGGVLGTAAIQLVLAGQALFAEPPLTWVSLLAIPGVLALLSSSFPAIATARAQGDKPETTAATGKTDTNAIVRDHLWAGVFGAVGNILLVVYLAAGFLLYTLLEAVLIDDAQIDLGYVADVVLPSLFDALWPLALTVGAITLVALPIIGWASAAQHRRERRRRPDVDRDLSPAEVAFVAACVALLKQRIEAQNHLALASRLGSMVLVSLALLVGAGMWAILESDNLIAWFHAPRIDGWSFYVPGSAAVPILLALLLGFALALTPRAMVALTSRRLSEAWAVFRTGAARSMAALEAQIVKAVRLRTLAPESDFDAAEFLRRLGAGNALSRIVFITLAVAIAIGVWPHDRMLDTLYTDDGIETGDFRTLRRAKFPYAAVRGVELKCRFDSNEDALVDYSLVLPGDMRRKLVTKRRLGARLDDFVRIDEKLRAAGVPFVFALPGEAPSQGEVVDRMCVVELADGMDEAWRAKVEQIFHLDEWYERRWRLRTRTPQISSS